jgi:hypothetical protein
VIYLLCLTELAGVIALFFAAAFTWSFRLLWPQWPRQSFPARLLLVWSVACWNSSELSASGFLGHSAARHS